MLFQKLPLELVEQVLCKLPPLEIVKCKQLSRYALNLINSSARIQLHLELAVDGMMLNNGEEQTVAASTMIDRVKARRTAFNSPELRLDRVLDCPQTGRYPFEICDGIWGRADKRVGDEFLRLRYDFLRPTYQDATSEPHAHDLDVPIVDFIFWTAEDLQILLEERDQGETRRLHFRTFSKNLIHPRAKWPYLDIHHHDCEAWSNCALILYGNRLGIALSESGWQRMGSPGGVIVWDWVTGEMIIPYRSALDATFISQDYVLLLIDVENALALDVTPLSANKKAHRLELPMHEDFYGAHFVTHPFYNTPLDGNNSHTASSNKIHLPLLTPDPVLDIAVLEYQYIDAVEDRDGQLMVISTQHLIDMCANQPPEPLNEANGSPELAGPTTGWDQWGSSMAKWLPTGMIKPSRRAVFGSRILVASPIASSTLRSDFKTTDESDEEVIVQLVLLDFNPRGISRTPDKSQAADDFVAALIKEIGRWSPNNPMPWTPDSQLKFHATVIKNHGEYLNVYFDGDGFVGRKDDCYEVCSFLPL